MRAAFCICLIVLLAAPSAIAGKASKLIQRSTHSKAKIRLVATLALKKFDTPRSVLALSTRLSSDSNPRVRMAAALSLSHILATKQKLKKRHTNALAVLKKASSKDPNKRIRSYCQKKVLRHSPSKKTHSPSEHLAVSLTFKSKELSTARQSVLLYEIKKILARHKKLQVIRSIKTVQDNDHYNLGFKHSPITSKKNGNTATVSCKISVRASLVKDQKEAWQSRKMAIATSSAEVIGPASRNGIKSSKETCLLHSMRHATQKELIPFLLAKSN